MSHLHLEKVTVGANPTRVVTNEPFQVTVAVKRRLLHSAIPDAQVSLSIESPCVTVEPANAKTDRKGRATFNCLGGLVFEEQLVRITASANGASDATSITITPE